MLTKGKWYSHTDHFIRVMIRMNFQWIIRMNRLDKHQLLRTYFRVGQVLRFSFAYFHFYLTKKFLHWLYENLLHILIYKSFCPYLSPKYSTLPRNLKKRVMTAVTTLFHLCVSYFDQRAGSSSSSFFLSISCDSREFPRILMMNFPSCPTRNFVGYPMMT